MNIIKRVATYLFIVYMFCITGYGLVIVNAYDFDAWYSNKQEIMKWNTNPTFAITSLNNNNTYVSGMDAAVANCNSAFGKNASYVHTSYITTNYAVQFYGGTKSQIDSLNIFSSGDYDNCAGLAKMIGKTYYGSYTKPTDGSVNGYILTQVRGFVQEDGLSASQHRHVCLHEVTHAFGWSGHTDRSVFGYINTVMYTYVNGITTFKESDIKHLKQYYDK